ncbi:hypothetical protein J7L48_03665 [bacterium]|nr:hypothetical protein [bacterium]
MKNNNTQVFKKNFKDIIPNPIEEKLFEHRIKDFEEISNGKSILDFKFLLFFLYKYLNDENFSFYVNDEFEKNEVDLSIGSLDFSNVENNNIFDKRFSSPIINISKHLAVEPEKNEIIIFYSLFDIKNSQAKEELFRKNKSFLEKLYIYYPKDIFNQ